MTSPTSSLLSVVLFTIVAFTSVSKADFPYTPDATLTGEMCTTADVDFTEFRYSSHVPYCNRNVTTATKRLIYDAYSVPARCRSDYTIDHFLPLSLGGSNSVNNLWPEAKSIKHLRQNLEYDLFRLLQAGKITQAEALDQIREAKWNPPITDPTKLQFCQ